MFGQVVGYALIKTTISASDVNYPFGPLSDLKGQRLQVLERNPQGDCLCLVNNGTAMADIMAKAIQSYSVCMA